MGKSDDTCVWHPDVSESRKKKKITGVSLTILVSGILMRVSLERKKNHWGKSDVTCVWHPDVSESRNPQ